MLPNFSFLLILSLHPDHFSLWDSVLSQVVQIKTCNYLNKLPRWSLYFPPAVSQLSLPLIGGDLIHNMRKTCILKWCNLKLSSVQNCLLVFVLVVCTFIYTLKLCHMLRLTAKALPLIKSTSTVQGCSSELLYSLGASTLGLTDHSC